MDEIQKLMKHTRVIREIIKVLPDKLQEMSAIDRAEAQQTLRIVSGEILQSIARDLSVISFRVFDK